MGEGKFRIRARRHRENLLQRGRTPARRCLAPCTARVELRSGVARQFRRLPARSKHISMARWDLRLSRTPPLEWHGNAVHFRDRPLTPPTVHLGQKRRCSSKRTEYGDKHSSTHQWGQVWRRVKSHPPSNRTLPTRPTGQLRAAWQWRPRRQRRPVHTARGGLSVQSQVRETPPGKRLPTPQKAPLQGLTRSPS
jgi:hypothetical protein